MNIITDIYNRRARLYPILLVVLPLALATLSWFPEGLTGWGIVWSVVVWTGGTAFLTQLGRDLGKRKENSLFKMWGGKPTTRMLRHRDAPNKEILTRQHKKLMQLMLGLKIPSLQEENDNPEKADEIYDSCTRFLINKTRDKKKFPLIFEENCSYGFRRNMWGLKPLGIIISSLGIIATLIICLLEIMSQDFTFQPISLICLIINISLLLVWIFWISPNWVRIPAEAYAERLLESCDKL